MAILLITGILKITQSSNVTNYQVPSVVPLASVLFYQILQ